MAYYASPNNGSNGSSALLEAMSNGSGTATGGVSVDGEAAGDGWIWDDATWILCASFIIFTMQTGRSWVEITEVKCTFDTVGSLNFAFDLFMFWRLRLLTEAAPTSSTFNLPYSPHLCQIGGEMSMLHIVSVLYFSVTLNISC